MKLKSSISIAALAVSFFALPGVGLSVANATDIYSDGGSYKDPTAAVPYAAPANHSGPSIKGFIGYSWGDRDINQTVNRFKNEVHVLGDEANAERWQEYVDDLNADGVSATFDGLNKVIPQLAHVLGVGGEDEFHSFVGGAEIEYLWQRGRFGVGLAGAVTFYGDGESQVSYQDLSPEYIGGTEKTPFLSEGDTCTGSKCAGDPSKFLSSGFVSVERNFDIDLTPKFYYFATPDFALFAKGGVSFANADIKSGSTYGHGSAGYDVSSSGDEWSVGYVLGGGFTKWLSQNTSLTLEGDWRKHEFSSSGSSSDITVNCDGDCSHGAASKHTERGSRLSTDVDDSVWTVKTGLSYHF